MSTPTPSNRDAAKGTPAASTPQGHLGPFSSPAPRSVPSPIDKRSGGASQASKSPFNVPTGGPTSSAVGALNHPTVGSSTGGTNTISGGKTALGSSPTPAGVLNFDSPGTMAFSLSNLGALDAAGMGLSVSGMSNLGMPTLARIDDEERRKRLEQVVAMLRTRTPKLSPEGLELLAKRCGLSVFLDPPGGLRKDGTRDCIMAGGTMEIEIVFMKQLVQKVKVAFPTSNDAVNKHIGSSASSILYNSLQVPPGRYLITMNLDKFWKHLEKLAQLDKLNGQPPTFNCFEAITGIYTSLRKLYEHEKKAALKLVDPKYSNKEERAEREVLCKRSGRPLMNARQSVGLNLDYWYKQRHVYRGPQANAAAGADAMNVDTSHSSDTSDNADDVFSLSIECESSPPTMFTAARNSDAWISDQVEKQANLGGDVFSFPMVDWLDPPETFLSNNNSGDALSLDQTGMSKLPAIRFVAKLQPPLAVPLQIAANLLDSVGVTLTQDTTPPQFDRILLKQEEPDNLDPLASLASLNVSMRTTNSSVIVGWLGKDGERTRRLHRNRLIASKPEYGKVLDEIPFAHPRQLIEMLPILRQWAIVNALLPKMFPPDSPEDPQIEAGVPAMTVDLTFASSPCPRLGIVIPDPDVKVLEDDSDFDVQKFLLEINGLDATDDSGGARDNTSVNLPSTGASKSEGQDGAGLYITIDMLENGEVAIVEPASIAAAAQTVNETAAAQDKRNAKSRRITKAFEICEDLDMWAEWLQRNADSLTA